MAHQTSGYLVLTGVALGIGLTTIVGQCLGAGKPEEAMKYLRSVVLLNYVIIIVLDIAALLTMRPLLGLFTTLSDEGADVAAQLLHSYMLFIFIWPLAFTVPSFLRAAGDVRFCMVVSICSMWLFRIAGAYLLVKVVHTGAIGIFIAMFLDWVFRAIVFGIRYRQGKWRQIQVI